MAAGEIIEEFTVYGRAQEKIKKLEERAGVVALIIQMTIEEKNHYFGDIGDSGKFALNDDINTVAVMKKLELMLIRSDAEIRGFCAENGIDPSDVEKVW